MGRATPPLTIILPQTKEATKGSHCGTVELLELGSQRPRCAVPLKAVNRSGPALGDRLAAKA
jgi:hypothetical protein